MRSLHVGGLLAVLLFLLGFSSATAQAPAGGRTLGVVMNEAQNASYDSARVRASDACSRVVHLFLPWPQLEPTPQQLGGPIYDLLPALDIYYPAYGLQVELNLPVVNTVRREVPADLDTVAFDDPLFVARFNTLVDSVLRLIPHVTLTVLNIGNESDAVLGTDPVQHARFRRFFQAARRHARAVYAQLHPGQPALRVGTTLSYHGLTGPLTAPLCRTLNDSADVVSTTYYGLQSNFQVLPLGRCRSELRRLVSAYPNPAKPIYLVECGYPSSTTLGSSDSLQAEFVGAVFQTWDSLAANIRHISFFQLTDWSQAEVDTLAVYYGFPSNTLFKEYLRTLGLRTWPGNGANKLAYERLRCEAGQRGFCSAPCRLPLAVPTPQAAVVGLQVYPNPATGVVRITGPLATMLLVWDARGQVVRAVPFAQGTANLTGLPPGLYLLRPAEAAQPTTAARLLVTAD